MGLLDDAIREHLELKRRRGADASEVSRQESDALGPVRRTPDGHPDPSDLPDLPQAGEAPGGEPVAAHEASPEPAPWEDATAAHAPAAPQPADEPPPVPAAYEPPAPAAYQPPAAPPTYESPAVPDPPAHAAYPPPPLPVAPVPAAYEPPAAPEPPAYEPPPPPVARDPEPDFDPFPELAHEEPGFAEPVPEERGLLSRFRRRRGPAEEEPAEPADPPTAAHEPQPPAAYEPPPPAPPAYEPPPYVPPVHEPDIVPADEEPEDLLEETPDFLEETPEHDRLWFEQRPPRDFDFDG